MTIKEHLVNMIDRLEYYITKEVEKNIYGTGDKCYVVLYDRIIKCINARKVIDYEPYQSVEAILEDHGYGEKFINKFVTRVHYCNDQSGDDETVSMRERLVVIIDILEYYLTQVVEKNIYGLGEESYVAFYNKLVECINARKEINYKPFQSVEILLEDHGYNKEAINKFIAKVNSSKKDTQ